MTDTPKPVHSRGFRGKIRDNYNPLPPNAKRPPPPPPPPPPPGGWGKK